MSSETSGGDAKGGLIERRLTWLGWGVLGLAPLLSTTWLLPAWQPQPFAAVLSLGLLLALGMAWWQAPRFLRGITGQWILPRSAHAVAAVKVGARLAAADGAPPLTLLAWPIGTQQPEVAARMAGFAVGRPRPAAVVASRHFWLTHFPRRGLQRLRPLSVCTTQPFGLVAATVEIGEEREFLVFPAIGQIRRAFEMELQRWMETHPLARHAGHDELASLRPYRPGDQPHAVHWKASARRQSLLVMERHATGHRKLALVVDTASGAQVWKLERLISAAATLVEYFCAQGWSLSLFGLFAPEGMRAGREGLLGTLARAKMEDGDIRTCIPGREAAIVLTLRPLPEIPPEALVLDLAQCERLMALPAQVH